MRLLFFSMWYTPEPVGKPHSLAKELKALGHDVTVVTGFPNYPEGSVYPDYRKPSAFLVERIDGIKIVRVRCMIDRSTSAVKRLLSMLSYSVLSFLAATLLDGRYDMVWSYQIGLPGSMYSILKGIPHVHEVQDLWPEWGQGSLGGMNGVLVKALIGFQRVIYLQATAISTISKGFAKKISTVYGIAISKIHVLPNWADEKAFGRKENSGHTRSEFGLNEDFVVTYGGNIGTAQGLEALVNAASALKGTGCRVVIAGDGVAKNKLERLSSELGASNIIYLPRLSPDRMGALLSVSDVLYIGLSRGEKYEITIPSKTYAYLSAGKPILASAEGDVADMLRNVGAGITCDAEDSVQIGCAICAFMKMTKQELNDMGDKALYAASERFSGNAVARHYEELLENLLRKQ